MEMAELIKLLKQRQGEMSMEEYANKMGTRTSTLHRQYSGGRNLSIDILQRYAVYFREKGDQEMIDALASYALGFDVEISS